MKIKEYTAVFKDLIIGNGKVNSYSVRNGNRIRVVIEFEPGETSEIGKAPGVYLPDEIHKLKIPETVWPHER